MAKLIATRQSYGRTLLALGGEDDKIVVLDADLSGSTMTRDFATAYPHRFFNAGIAEANMYGMAAGLAVSGKTVFASTFAMFAAGRAFEIIRNSIAYTGANVKVCATHAGLTVGEDGASHQAIEDLALMCAVPGMTVVNPADDLSAEQLIRQAAATPGPFYVRLGRAAVPVLYEDHQELSLGRAVWLRRGKDATIIATGIMVAKALEAAETLALEGLEAGVVDMHTLKPLDEGAILEAAETTGCLITAEEHSIRGGLGAAAAQVCSRRALASVTSVAIQDCFGESGKPDQLLEKYGLTAESIAQAVRQGLAAKG